MDKKSNSSIGAGNSRSAAIRTKVLRAMRAIRREIAANASHGDQSNSITAKEVATRAGIHPTTFHTRKQRTLGARVKTWVRLLNTRAAQEEVVPARRRGCTEFCVNGQSTAGASRPVRKHNEHQETRRTRRTAVWPAGQLQEA